MRKTHRAIAIICLISILVCPAGCAKNESGTRTNYSLTSTGAINYSGTELTPPEEQYIFSSASADENYIYVYGYPITGAEDVSEIQLYTLDGLRTKSFEIPLFSEAYKETIMDMCADNCGKLWLLKYLSEYEYVNGEPVVSDAISCWVATAYGENGNVLATFKVSDGDAQYTGISANNEYILITGADGLHAFDSTGNALCSLNDGYIFSSFFDSNNQANILSNKLGKRELCILDVQTGKTSMAQALPDSTNRVMPSPTAEYDFLVEMSGSLYGANRGSSDFKLIADFVNFSIIHNNRGIIPLPGNKILIYSSQKLQLFSPAADSESVTTLTLGTLDSIFLSDMVEKFNLSSSKYNIQIVDYSQYNLSSDSSEGIVKLNTEIIAGNGPDIFDLFSLPAAQYERAGILVDLYPYINSDEQTKNTEFVAPVIAALETDGKLYKLVPSYSIMTVVGSQHFFETGALNFDMLAQLSVERGDPFDGGITKKDFLECILSVDKPAFVDYQNCTCNFNSEAFVKLLNYMSSLPDERESRSESRSIMSGTQLLTRQHVSDYYSIYRYNYLFNSTVCFPGIPAMQKTGSIVCPYICLGISQNCRDKDGAWEFLKQFLLDEYQNRATENSIPFPISKSALDLTEGTFRKWAEENGEMYVGPDNTGKDVMLHISKTEEDESVNKINELFSTIIGVYNNDFSLPDLVWECISPYFVGEKTAEEVAAATQSRVSIYLAEQYG